MTQDSKLHIRAMTLQASQSWGYFVDPDDETKMPTKLPELKRWRKIEYRQLN